MLRSVSNTGVSGSRHAAADRHVLGPARETGRAGAANTIASPSLSSSSLPRPIAPPTYLRQLYSLPRAPRNLHRLRRWPRGVPWAAMTRPRPLDGLLSLTRGSRRRSSGPRMVGPRLFHHHVCSLLVAGPPRRPPICESRLGTPLRSLRHRPLLCVRDICSGARFLVDSGGEVSVVPAADTDRRAQPRTVYDLLAANRTAIPTYGTQTRRVALLPGSRFPWAFVVADVEQAILGMDFLAAHDLLVDPRRRCLLHQPSNAQASLVFGPHYELSTGVPKESVNRFRNGFLGIRHPLNSEP
ncbi:hypothetical protein E2C01_045137 [Portunus trituberculatus]|uniref:Peptidase A2 domain-containing protein n=1 Tax=Portunus trituberculatus TaxID=210409 RepID=A0A5B7FXG6_PORTR|nr:hypothetical protein [Portunus trituberculatus]